MDPNACLKRWLQALLDGDDDEADEAHHDLKCWIDNGGFLPSWTIAQRDVFDMWPTDPRDLPYARAERGFADSRSE